MHPSRAEEEAVWRHRARVVADLTLTHATSMKDQTDESDRQLLRPIQLLQEFAEASLSDRRRAPKQLPNCPPYWRLPADKRTKAKAWPGGTPI